MLHTWHMLGKWHMLHMLEILYMVVGIGDIVGTEERVHTVHTEVHNMSHPEATLYLQIILHKHCINQI